VVTESIFGLPGLGQLAILSMTEQDLPVVTGIVMVGAVFVVVGNIGVDMIYPILDPRVRLR
jgi:peptide/nickel transport system permease protein